MSKLDPMEKKIKRYIYAQPQSILIQFPAGLSDVAKDEARFILDNLWFENKFSSEITLLKNALRIDKIHMFAVIELMIRGLCFTDIRLIINECKVENMPAFEKKCGEVFWDFFVSDNLSIKIKIDSGASPKLHEGAMKDFLINCLETKVNKTVSGEATEDAALIHVDIYKYELTMSISLAGAPLYKRGYRSVLSHSAPLREDIAASCIQKALQFGPFACDSLLVPFSGTGTFLFEYWIKRYQFAPILFERVYAIKMMPLFRADHFNFLLKKAREHSLIEKLSENIFCCIDSAESANIALLKNVDNFKIAVEKNQLTWHVDENHQWLVSDDFLKINAVDILARLSGDLFIPINPPYGIRLSKNNDTVSLYKKIARQLNALSNLAKNRNSKILGFILCPSEESWSAFCNTLTSVKIETYHITQGGLDIRVAQFCF